MKSTFFAFALLFSQVHAQYTAEVLPIPGGRGQALGAGGGQIIGVSVGSGGPPGMWSGQPYSFSSMMPKGFDLAGLRGVGGGKQIGYAYANGRSHALLWSGSANNYVDLDVPAYVTGTDAWATDGVSQVGAGGVGVHVSHALLWHGTAQSVVNLHPAGYEWSQAHGVWGGVQVGVVENRPVMWKGSAASMVALPRPKQFAEGGARAVHDNQIVGYSNLNASAEAVMWDADTLGFTHLGGGFALDTNGSVQVGFSGSTFNSRAKAWFGAPGTELDLHQFLAPEIASSEALGIDENGTIVGWGHINGGFGSVPIVWTPVPEPSGLFALALGIGALAMKRRRER